MIDGYAYLPIYLTIVTAVTLFCVSRYAAFGSARINVAGNESLAQSFILMLVLVLFIGLRPVHRVFVDMMNYNYFFNYNQNRGVAEFNFDWDAENLLFDNIFNYMAYSGTTIMAFMLVIATIYFYAIWKALRRWFPNDTLYAFVIYLGAFSTYSYATNGVKAGAAASLFLLALAYCDNLKYTIPLALISWFFHHSMFTVLAAYALTFFVKKPKYYLAFWGICVLCAMVHINPLNDFMVSMSDERGAMYLTNIDNLWGGKLGFRLDFLLYSAIPIAIGYYYVITKDIKDKCYNQLFNLYVLTNALWVLCMYIPFNNRVAYLSWFMLPVVSIYPFLKLKLKTHKQYSKLNQVAIFYLAFTIFMEAIYYV